MRLNKAEREFLAYQRVCRVATVGTDGLPHNVPVCPILVNDRVYLASEATATKVRNIRATGQAAVTFDEYTEAWSGLKGMMLRGAGKLIDRGPTFRRIRRLLYQRYPQYEGYAALEEKETVIVEVTPTRKFSWGL
jgi:hypothetical protein